MESLLHGRFKSAMIGIFEDVLDVLFLSNYQRFLIMLKKGDGFVLFFIVSAFGDYRFKPMSLSEIPRLKCSVSLLHSFEEARDYKDWEVLFIMMK